MSGPIDYNSDSHLLDFLIHYSTTDPGARSHDTTVGSPTKAKIELARETVPELRDMPSLLAITISNKQSSSRCNISSPEPQPDIPVGQWTQSLFTLDTASKRHVLLKDSWHVIMKGIEPEGVLYHQLHDNHICNISSVLLAGDVEIGRAHV